MKSYQILDDVEVDASYAGEIVELSEEGKAIGSLVDWRGFWNPAYISLDEQWVRNCAIIQHKDPAPNLQLGAFDNAAPALRAYGDGVDEHLLRVDIDFEFNPNRFTFITVLQPAARASGALPASVFNTSATGAPTNYTAFSAGFSRDTAENFTIYKTSALVGISERETRLQHVADFAQRSSPSLIMCTFSVERGLSIMDGGVVVESNPDDKTPIDWGHTKDVAKQLFRNGYGRFGITGFVNGDLSAPENAGKRRRIESFLMSKYGIPEGPQ